MGYTPYATVIYGYKVDLDLLVDTIEFKTVACEHEFNRDSFKFCPHCGKLNYNIRKEYHPNEFLKQYICDKYYKDEDKAEVLESLKKDAPFQFFRHSDYHENYRGNNSIYYIGIKIACCRDHYSQHSIVFTDLLKIMDSSIISFLSNILKDNPGLHTFLY